MPKREGDVDAVEAAPPHQQPLVVAAVRRTARRHRPLLGEREGDGQLARRRHVAQQHVGPRVPRLLAAQEHVGDGARVGRPRRHHRARRERQHDERRRRRRAGGAVGGEARRELRDELVLVEPQRRSVARFGRRGAAAHDRDVGGPGGRERHLHVVARLDAHRHAARAQPRRHRDGVRADDAAAAADDVVVARRPVVWHAVKVRRVARRSEQRDRAAAPSPSRLLERQHAAVVLEQRDALGADLPRELRVLRPRRVDLPHVTAAVAPRRALWHPVAPRVGGHHPRDDPPRHRVEVEAVAAAHDAEVGRVEEAVGAGHVLVDAARGRARVVRRPPVGHHPAAEAHLPLQVRLQHVRAAAHVRAVDLVVPAHEGGDARAHRRLERRVVDLPQRAVRRVARLRVAVRLLRVERKVLDDGGDALALHALDVRRRQRRAERAVLARQVLGVAAVARDAVHVDARPEDDVGALFLELAPERDAPPPREVAVPRRGEREGARPRGHLPDGLGGERAEALRGVLHVDRLEPDARHAEDRADVEAGHHRPAAPPDALHEPHLLVVRHHADLARRLVLGVVPRRLRQAARLVLGRVPRRRRRRRRRRNLLLEPPPVADALRASTAAAATAVVLLRRVHRLAVPGGQVDLRVDQAHHQPRHAHHLLLRERRDDEQQHRERRGDRRDDHGHGRRGGRAVASDALWRVDASARGAAPAVAQRAGDRAH